MSYQPRRIADIVDDPAAEDTDQVAEINPRRAATSLVDKLFHRGGGLAAAITVAATAAAVLIGATGGAASAVGVPLAAAAPVPSQQLIAEELVLVKPTKLTTKTAHATALAVSRQYTEGSLNVRSEPAKDAELLGRVSAASQVEATSDIEGDYRKIVFEDGFGWVLADELSDSAEAAVPDGTSMAPCSRGSQVENKLRKTTIFIYRSVCPLFPDLNSVGGWRAGGRSFHKNGRALDLMLTPGDESALGWRITKYLIAHRAEFKIDHIIFEQKIWTPSSGRWKKMADRGSVTANHFNHVHVAVATSAP
ncbi:MAG: hypothetical protein CVT62_05275 [Actinobacteria bacterium HGW-Actinobacteria-2]|nr:MAG: hypothetical protein CVT62_05275 [Actinobacteria bacterium HGW-Actinobacteria-2]